MQSILRDIRYGFRSLVKSPGLTIVATIALTLGIGLTTTMFSIVYGAMLKGLPFPNGDRVVAVYRSNPARGDRHMSVPISDYADYVAQQHTLSIISATYTGTVNVSGVGQAERYNGAWVTSSTFDIPKTAPALGRTLLPEDDAPNGAKVAVLSYGLWKTRFGGLPSAIGEVIRANGQPFTIVGVMPEKFAFPDNVDLWLPLQMDPLTTKRGEGQQLQVFGMLKPGVSLDQASVDFASIAKRLQTEFKATNADIEAAAQPFIDAYIGEQPHQLLWAMLGAVFLVLLVACANVANLLLDRAAHKTKEVGIRTALGASRGAVVRQFLTESLVLSVAGAIGGTAIAYAGITAFNRVMIDQAGAPAFIDIRLHPPVLAFVVLLALTSTLFSGLIPAVQSSRVDINEVLKDENRGSSSLKMGRMSRALVVLEVALSCGLLVTSGLMIKSVTKLKTMDPGFRPQEVFTARVGFPAGYTDTVAQKLFMVQLRQKLAALPGARGASISSSLPGTGANGGAFTVEGASYASERDIPNTDSYAVSDGFFETFEVKLLEGRGINSSDRADAAPVAVVNKAFADKYFAGTDPIGRRIREGNATSTNPWMTIVGVAVTTFSGDAGNPRKPAYFAPLSQHHSSFVSLAVKTSGPPMAITSAVRQAVTQLNTDIPLYRVYSMEEAISRPLWYIRTFGTMFMIFGGAALFLAAIGLYAVMSFAVSRRTKEVGIRMALGAQGGQVIRMIFRQGAMQLGLGMTFGLLLATGLAQATQVILFEVQPRDPQVFGGVVVVLAITGMVACLIPARRATRVDPLTALRSQ